MQTHLTNSTRLKMQVLLLRIASLALKALVTNLSIDQHLTSQNTNADTAIGKTVEQCRPRTLLSAKVMTECIAGMVTTRKFARGIADGSHTCQRPTHP